MGLAERLRVLTGPGFHRVLLACCMNGYEGKSKFGRHTELPLLITSIVIRYVMPYFFTYFRIPSLPTDVGVGLVWDANWSKSGLSARYPFGPMSRPPTLQKSGEHRILLYKIIRMTLNLSTLTCVFLNRLLTKMKRSMKGSNFRCKMF